MIRTVNQFFLGTIGEVIPDYYQPVLDYAIANSITTPDSATNARNRARAMNLVRAGIWDSLDLFYCFDHPSGLSGFSKINWINPGDNTLFNANPALEPDFVADSGFKSDGSKWFDTGWNPTVDANNIIIDTLITSRFSFFYKGFDWSANGIQEGVFGNFQSGSNQTQVLKLNNNTTNLVRLCENSGGSFSLDPTLNNNHFLNSGSGQNAGLPNGLYIDGVFNQLGAKAGVSPAVNLPYYLFAVNINGTAGNFSMSGLKYFGLGGYLGGTDPNQKAIDLYKIMNDTY